MKKQSLKLLVVAGARPNFMKIAPLLRAFVAHNERSSKGKPRLEWKLVHTGQHYDVKMSDVFFQELHIPAPDINLGIGSGSHATQTAAIMTAFEPICQASRPDWVVVVGDVNSTLACTLVAAKMGIRVAHIEAGLRSFDRTMPEEINRIVTDSLADLLLTPSEDASENLRREGIAEAKIRLVGNIMIDSVKDHMSYGRNGRMLEQLGLAHRGYIYVTLHRPANVDHRESLTAITRELSSISKELPVIFPVHPRTRRQMEKFDLSFSRDGAVRLLDPIGYNDSLALTEHARCVLTDSGGLQEESTFFRTPCLTLRPNTERPVTITLGSNKLTRVQNLRADLDTCLSKEGCQGEIPPLWDGRTAERIVEALCSQ